MDDVTVSNLALSHISQAASVTSINPPDGTANAQHCAMFYNSALDMMLEMHGWGFATFRTSLALLPVQPSDLGVSTPSWSFAYQVPSGMIRALAVLLPGATDDTQGQEFTIEMLESEDPQDAPQKVLYTNAELPTLKYIKRVADTGKWTPMFGLAFSWLLAHFIAGPITKKPNVVQNCLEQFFKVYLPLAKSLDAVGQQFNPIENHVPDHLRARGIVSFGHADGRIIRH